MARSQKFGMNLGMAIYCIDVAAQPKMLPVNRVHRCLPGINLHTQRKFEGICTKSTIVFTNSTKIGLFKP